MNAIPILTCSLATMLFSPAASGLGASGSIHVRAWIDGRSRIILDDDTAVWQHFDFAAPGRLDCDTGAPIQPTYLEGVPWLPDWPDVPDCENRFCGGCFSSTYTGLASGLPNGNFVPALVLIEARGSVAIVEAPSAANGWRVVIQIDDNAFGGAAWYELDLVLGPEFAAFCNAADKALAACPCANPGDPDTGCENARGTGGVGLTVTSFDPVEGSAVLLGTQFPATTAPTVVAIRGTQLEPSPLTLGDGIVCITTPVTRVSTATAAMQGASTHSIVHQNGPGSFHYQLWYRSQPATYCTPAAYNTSSGVTLVW